MVMQIVHVWLLDCSHDGGFVVFQFQLYGEPVVKACINQKCNYVDITGETYVSVVARQCICNYVLHRCLCSICTLRPERT